jgi:hypothetical protein
LSRFTACSWSSHYSYLLPMFFFCFFANVFFKNKPCQKWPIHTTLSSRRGERNEENEKRKTWFWPPFHIFSSLFLHSTVDPIYPIEPFEPLNDNKQKKLWFDKTKVIEYIYIDLFRLWTVTLKSTSDSFLVSLFLCVFEKTFHKILIVKQLYLIKVNWTKRDSKTMNYADSLCPHIHLKEKWVQRRELISFFSSFVKKVFFFIFIHLQIVPIISPS